MSFDSAFPRAATAALISSAVTDQIEETKFSPPDRTNHPHSLSILEEGIESFCKGIHLCPSVLSRDLHQKTTEVCARLILVS